MPGENRFQVAARLHPENRSLQRAIRIKQQKRDMRHTVASGKRATFGLSDVSDKVKHVALAELSQRFARLALQSGTGRALWIMHLHNDRFSLPDLG